MDAYAKSKTPKEERDKRQTPVSVFERIQEIINIPIIHDVAAEAHTAKTRSFWTIEDDALSKNWSDCSQFFLANTVRKIGNSAFWMNPPYSDPAVWCKKAYEESQKDLIVVGLLPDDRSTGWYQDWIEDKAQLVYVPNKRISFEDGENNPQKGNPKGSIIPVWMPMYCDKTNYVRFDL